MTIREYRESDLPEMVRVWNEVIEAGIYFDYDEILTVDSARDWFAGQTAAVVAEDDNGHICGMYILHPNGRGRTGHIANASYAVEEASRGRHIGEALVRDSMDRAKAAGFRILQYNCVVEDNAPARKLYDKLGFRQIGTIAGGLKIKDGSYVNTCPYYIDLELHPTVPEEREPAGELILTPSPAEEKPESKSAELVLEAEDLFKAKEITFDGEAESEARIADAMKEYDAAMDNAAKVK